METVKRKMSNGYLENWRVRQIHRITVYHDLLFSWSVMSDFNDPMDYSMPGFPVLHHLPELAQTHVHWVGDAIQPSHPLLAPSPPAFNLSQHQCLFQWGGSSHQMVKVFEFQLQHQSLPMNFQGWFPLGLTVWSPCSPRDSLESSATPPFESVKSSVFSLF